MNFWAGWARDRQPRQYAVPGAERTRSGGSRAAAAAEQRGDRGEVVIHQGDVGEYFYLVESGEAEVIIEGRGVVKQYTRGDYFGGTLSVPLLGLEFIWRGWGLWTAIVEGYAFLTCSFGSWSPACSFLQVS